MQHARRKHNLDEIIIIQVFKKKCKPCFFWRISKSKKTELSGKSVRVLRLLTLGASRSVSTGGFLCKL